MGRICIKDKSIFQEGEPHKPACGGENAQAFLKHSERTGLSEVEGL